MEKGIRVMGTKMGAKIRRGAVARRGIARGARRKMMPKVDMTYSFMWDTEPTDEQLAVIMEGVAEKVRREKAYLARKQELENKQ